MCVHALSPVITVSRHTSYITRHTSHVTPQAARSKLASAIAAAESGDIATAAAAAADAAAAAAASGDVSVAALVDVAAGSSDEEQRLKLIQQLQVNELDACDM